MTKRIVASVVALVASAALLTACGSDAQNGEFPYYGKDEAYDLTEPEQFEEFVKEYGELPDDYIERAVDNINREEGTEFTVRNVNSAGKETCESEDALILVRSSIGLYELDMDADAFSMSEREIEEALAPVAEKLDLDSANGDDREMTVAIAGLGAINNCESEFTGDQLQGAGRLYGQLVDG